MVKGLNNGSDNFFKVWPNHAAVSSPLMGTNFASYIKIKYTKVKVIYFEADFNKEVLTLL